MIVGGESGPGARPMHPRWAQDIRDQCQEAGVPFFFKQWGEWCPYQDKWANKEVGFVGTAFGKVMYGNPTVSNSATMSKAGRKAAGSLLDGVEHREMP